MRQVLLAIKVDYQWKETIFDLKDPDWRLAFLRMKESGYPMRLIYL